MDTTYDSTNKTLKNDVKDGARNVKNVATEEFKNFVTDIEDVVKSVSHVTDADVARVRAKIQSAINSTRDGVEITAANLTKRAREAATQADTYVRESPWQAVGIGAAIAALIGVSVGILASRR
jgi:ElaB/YqjD/DUF883 family membrane-anchored ribosome-binding protein